MNNGLLELVMNSGNSFKLAATNEEEATIEAKKVFGDRDYWMIRNELGEYHALAPNEER